MHKSMTEQWGKYYNVLGNHLGCKTAKGNRTKYIYWGIMYISFWWIWSLFMVDVRYEIKSLHVLYSYRTLQIMRPKGLELRWKEPRSLSLVDKSTDLEKLPYTTESFWRLSRLELLGKSQAQERDNQITPFITSSLQFVHISTIWLSTNLCARNRSISL